MTQATVYIQNTQVRLVSACIRTTKVRKLHVYVRNTQVIVIVLGACNSPVEMSCHLDTLSW